MFVPISILVLSTIQYASTNFTFPSRQSDTSTNTSRDPGVNLSPNVNLGNEVSGEGRNLFNYDPGTSPGGPPREGKHLFNWLDDIVTPERDPYIKKLNDGCLEGNLYECFKWKALSNLESFFNYDQYGLNENTKVIKIFRETSAPQDSEFARSIPQTQEPEFDSFLQFLGRKMESFIKSRAIEVNLPEDVTEYGRYEPKALFDDIASERHAGFPILTCSSLSSSFTTFIIPKVLLRIHHHIVRCLNQKDSEFPILTPNSSFSL
ncbi:hypothetical protein M8J75_002245 [Diaphorina citri]|nr:hypothetical protein M8J75_002245 [Diaphorina citri]